MATARSIHSPPMPLHRPGSLEPPRQVAVGMTRPALVEHPHHPLAAPAACQTGQQGPSAPARLARGALLHMRVLTQRSLVLLETLPGDVALVVVAQQYSPVGHRALVAFGLPRPSGDDPGSPCGPPEGVGPGIDRALQDLVYRVVGGRAPFDMARNGVAPHHRQAQPGGQEPQINLPRAAEFAELLEHETDRAGHSLVGVDLDSPALAPAIAWSAESAARDARGAPISMPTQAAGSSIQAATLTIWPGCTSTEATEPPARCSMPSRRGRRPKCACHR